MKRLALLFLLLLAVVGVYGIRRPTIETSLFALVGEGGIQMHPEVLTRGSGEIQVLFLAPTMAQALPVAEHFEAQLPRAAFKAIRFKLDDAASQQLLDFYRLYPTGILAPKQAESLLKGDYAKLRQQALRKWHTSLVPLYTVDQDPFFFLNHFITSRPLSMAGWQTALNGVLSTETEEGVALLLALSLHPTDANNPDALIPIVDQLKTLAATTATSEVAISISGVPLHTVEVAGKCKREITWLSLFSLGVILIVAWVALKSFRVYPYLLYILTLSGGVGVLTTLLCCSSIHLLAGVFATTLLGLTIDYAFHGCLTHDREGVRKNLLCSWITTELSLLPLLFSGMPILVQSAIFMMSGLAAALIGVLFTLKGSATPTPQDEPPVALPMWVRRLPLFLGLALLPALYWIQFGTDLQDFHAPSQGLLEAEKRFRELTFPATDDDTLGMLVIEGDTLETVIEREEALTLPEGTPRVSNFLPSLKRRQTLYPNLQQLYATEGATLTERLGIDPLTAPSAPQPWTADVLPALLRDNFFIQTAAGGYLSVIPNVPAPKTTLDGIHHYNPQRVMQQTVDQLSAVTRLLLAIVGLVLLAVLLITFKKRALWIALPSLLAVGTVFICFGVRGGTLNLFHLLACFMLIGMSLDYTIFFASGDRKAIKPVTCSFLTSLAGFGALALVSFMVVRSIGQVFAVGLTIAYASAFLLFWGRDTVQAPTKDKQTEFAATRFGMQLVVWIYRLLGKWAMDLSGYVVANTLWFTSAKIRRFTRSRQRLICFVQSMIDKFAVMSCGRGQPRVEIADDAETQAFIEAVQTRKGVFLLSSHFGAMEVLPAAASTEIPLHAFMHVAQTAVFNQFYFEHFKRPSVHIHPVAGFGMGELFEAGTYLDNGDCILMAGDRAFGLSQTVTFLGQPCTFPKGVYRFAKLLEHPIYFVVCYRVRRNVYRVEARAIQPNDRMVEHFIEALEPFVKAHPEQWYNWEILP